NVPSKSTGNITINIQKLISKANEIGNRFLTTSDL
ncbi:unnamed protein product, partial [marine sediment metagenome]